MSQKNREDVAALVAKFLVQWGFQKRFPNAAHLPAGEAAALITRWVMQSYPRQVDALIDIVKGLPGGMIRYGGPAGVIRYQRDLEELKRKEQEAAKELAEEIYHSN